MKKRKMMIIISAATGAIGVLLPYIEIAQGNSEFTFLGVMSTILIGISYYLKKTYDRKEEINELFKEDTEEEKEKI